MNTLQDAFEQSTDAVIGIDAAGRVRFANGTFGRLLGYNPEQLCGTRCGEVLCGTDIQGHSICGKHCPISKTAADSPLISDFDLVVKSADGNSVLVNIGACYIPRQLRELAGQVDVFFSLRRINSQRLLQRMATAPIEGSAMAGTGGRSKLTSREKEILGLATEGLQTTQIASKLCISTLTVRTHFKNIYPKLGVNSRTEAVISAMQRGQHQVAPAQ